MSIPAGVYRIARWGSHEHGQVLTLKDDRITVLPPGGAPERAQEWRVETVGGGGVAIQIPANIFPSRSLSYEGEAEKGKRIIPGPLNDFPTRKWLIERAPQLPLPVPYFIRVPDKDLIIVVSPADIFPPELILGASNLSLQNAWTFELVRHE
ncbi:uncharacterized protein LACBIDRAFT_293765 [Laccaria bicolor S238N-H82]|uniref:Predicted protein n=1 Tax=Laccaria bicolor (strain S238N-H82 / ATCC MYA-4686) TaxID=486041 RepID=B0D6E7_LACBS|nr:uncharacterized protein LACBIDRAFT_293765 [Laccaria bicolor S238N-H82]EDR10176.1 predicted protein [Laccaria bicolor S238N-H82]|eukprot:XP_001879561.1 predicted protein [Laccaria bicolor S238N-H82]